MSVPASEPAPRISVVVPTFERRAAVEAMAAAVLPQEGLHELVFLVDGSSDGTVEALQELAAGEPKLKYAARENRGAVQSRLDGVRVAEGDVVLLLDDDVLPGPGLVSGHLARHLRGDRLLVLGYMPIPEELRRGGSFPTELYAAEYERGAERWEADPGEILRGFWAGNFSLRREHYLELSSTLGAIPEIYHEDLDFGLCLLEAGFEAVFDRSLRARHLYTRDAAGFMRDARRAAEGDRIVHQRHPALQPSVTAAEVAARLSAPEGRLARLGARSRPALAGLLAAARLAGALRLRRVSRRLGHLCWCSEQIRVLRGGVE